MNSNWSYGPETAKLGVDLCDLDLWPWPFAWTSLLSLVITPKKFMMIQWWEYSQKGVTERRTDRQTDWTIHRAAWSQLKIQYGPQVAILKVMSLKINRLSAYSNNQHAHEIWKWNSKAFDLHSGNHVTNRHTYVQTDKVITIYPL